MYVTRKQVVQRPLTIWELGPPLTICEVNLGLYL